jgi:N-acetylglucosaminyldiphosphoundecaprenol N-acetyl-beta-D-mannosaminyltransferase
MLEPRRLARRYLRDDLPFAIELLARTTMHRVTR